MTLATPSVPEQLRITNLGRILDLVHTAGPQSRSALRSRTGLTRSTIATLVGELSTLGLVVERPPSGPRPPGRPSPVVVCAPAGPTVVAFDVQVGSVTAALVGLGGRVHRAVRWRRRPVPISPQATVEDVACLLERLLDGARPPPSAVAVGVAGVVSERDGVVHHAPNLGWRDVPLGALLAERLGTAAPVVVANEADAGALAEHLRGAGAAVSHMVYVHSEVGLGAGVVVDGRLLRGAEGFAGEVGHMPVDRDGLRCGCGSRGCWETVAGQAAVLAAAGIAERGPVGVEALVTAALAEHPEALDALDAAGRWVGYGLATVVNLLNPQLVVLGGFFSEVLPWIEASVDAQLHSYARLPGAERVRITGSRLRGWATVLGAAELALRPLLADPPRVVDSPWSRSDPAQHDADDVLATFDRTTTGGDDPPPPSTLPQPTTEDRP